MDPGDLQRAFAGELSTTFRYVSDTSRNLSVLLGAADDAVSISRRMSVLIDREGTVRWICRNVDIYRHGFDVVDKMRELRMLL